MSDLLSKLRLNKAGHFVIGSMKTYRDISPRLSMQPKYKAEILHRCTCHDDLVTVARAVKQRIHFIGLPSEPKDWAKEVALIEAALAKVNGGK